ncbi:MAG TPA: cysteine desulfurase [Saprospiraceae bacterium]|nr:cysteine desulfurase [Saprospiraceae bacterium]
MSTTTTDTYKKASLGERVRPDFPILEREMNGQPMVFLDSAASSQKPQAVIDSISHYYTHTHANVHRGLYQLSQEATNLHEEARIKARDFLNARSEREIIFTRGTTEGINLVAHCLSLCHFKEGDEIVLSEMEHHSNIVPWQMVAERLNLKIKVIPVTDEGELDMEAYDHLLNERTALVSIVQVSNTLGTINPVDSIVSKAKKRNIPVLIDGAQSTPHMAVDVQKMQADFFVCSSHKMLGPTGFGLLYGKEEWLDRFPPYQGGGEMIRSVSFEKTTYNELPFKFEAGTPHIAGAVGTTVAMEYMEKLGFSAIEKHEKDLLDYGTAKLSQIDGLRIVGQAKNKAGVISFLVDGTHPSDVGMLLDKFGIAVRTGHHCTEPLMTRYGIPGTVRASFSVYNTLEDIDRLYESLQKAVKMLR